FFCNGLPHSIALGSRSSCVIHSDLWTPNLAMRVSEAFGLIFASKNSDERGSDFGGARRCRPPVPRIGRGDRRYCCGNAKRIIQIPLTLVSLGRTLNRPARNGDRRATGAARGGWRSTRAG